MKRVLMNVRTATNEQILTWPLPRTGEDDRSNAQAEASLDVLTAISALASQHSALLFRVAFSVLRSAHDAEDVVQETFLRVLKHQKNLARIDNPRVWLVRIAWNLAIDRKRRAAAVPLINEAEEILRNQPSAAMSAADAIRDAESCVRILRMMDQLPPREREVLRLSAIEELGTPEIAAVLKTTESSVRSRLFRARQHLRERLNTGERRKQP